MTTKKQYILIAIILICCLAVGVGIGMVISNIDEQRNEDKAVTEESDKLVDAGDAVTVTETLPVTEESTETSGAETAEAETSEETTAVTESKTETAEPEPTEAPAVTEEKKSDTSKDDSKKAETKATATPTPAATSESSTKKESGTPVANHGQLSVKGTSIVDEKGNAYQIQGVSTHGLQWFPQYVTKETFKTLRDEWGVNCIRLAMYTYESGYCDGADKTKLKKVVTDGVDYATELGMYVIIDWHVLNDQNPTKYQSEAEKFFTEMAKKYANNNNVIYEICNEPNSGVSWSTIKTYAEDIIPIIRKYSKNAIIIVGTPTWSQDVDVVAKDPIKNQTNIMYALHFYAGTHKDDLRNKYKTAIAAGLPIFVSEFGITDASGNGNCDTDSANTWISLLTANHTAYCIWNLANKNESSCLLKSSCTKVSGFTENDLSEEGKWYVNLLSGGINLPKVDTSAPSNSSNSTNNDSNNGGGSSDAPKAISYTGGGATVSSNGSWTDGGKACYTLAFSFDSDVTGKTVTVTFNANITALDSWGGDVSVSGKTLTVKNTQSWFGMNIAGDSELTVKSVSIK